MMKRVFRTMAPLALTAIFAAAAFGQEAPPPPPDMMVQQIPDGPGGPGPGGPGFHKMELLGFGGFHGRKVVTGAPLSAVAVTTVSHSLADGTKINNTIKVTLYRDSQGRFRKEGDVPRFGDASADQTRSFVVISDPVASKGYLLNPDKKIAHVSNMPNRGRKGDKGHGPVDAEAGTNADGGKEWNDTNVTKTSLGTQTINGVSAQGTRYTRVIPAGNIGNDKPITITREVWYSSDLQMVVQSKHSDPRFGDTSYSLTNIQRTEPAANLFTVPSDYTIKQDGGPRGHMKRGQTPPPPADAPAAPTM
ncbi:MAG TPA: hypothetical protein VN025_06565 [Candidatus Dormibacteraeota bacterium]|jgi:hypothetical protein|nr:hypothetical protein [Candidatus Dormibacteraeota bacterium]